MTGLLAQVLAAIRLPEQWTTGNVLGAIFLGLVAVALAVVAVFVTLRR